MFWIIGDQLWGVLFTTFLSGDPQRFSSLALVIQIQRFWPILSALWIQELTPRTELLPYSERRTRTDLGTNSLHPCTSLTCRIAKLCMNLVIQPADCSCISKWNVAPIWRSRSQSLTTFWTLIPHFHFTGERRRTISLVLTGRKWQRPGEWINWQPSDQGSHLESAPKICNQDGKLNHPHSSDSQA